MLLFNLGLLICIARGESPPRLPPVKIPDKQAELMWSTMATGEFHLSLLFDSSQGEQPRLTVETASRPGRALFGIDVATKQNRITLTLPGRTLGPRVVPLRAPLDNGEAHSVVMRVNGSHVFLSDNCRQLLSLTEHDLAFDSQEKVGFFVRDLVERPRKPLYDLSVATLDSTPFPCDRLEIIIDSYTTSEKSSSYSRISHIEDTLKQLRSFVSKLDRKVNALEEDRRVCVHDSSVLAFGEKRVDTDACTQCTCGSGGDLVCGPLGCPSVNCSHPATAPGECCPACKKECRYNNKAFEHGEVTRPQQCVECKCDDGEMLCEYTHPSYCPELNCTDRYTPENGCCAMCTNQDFCADANPCSPNAACENRPHGAHCRCHMGFIGNGTHCYDMDECLWSKDARDQLGGCTDGSICVNLPGSFRCDCLPGFIRLNERSCLNLIRF